MKINRKLIRKLIKEEYKRVLFESQQEIGLSHKFSDQELYMTAMNFINYLVQTYMGRVYNISDDDTNKANKFITILNNRIQKAVRYDQGTSGGYGTEGWIPGREPTSDGDIEFMRGQQGKLKMVRNLLLQTLDRDWEIPSGGSGWRGSRSEGFRQAAKEFENVPEDEKPHWAKKDTW